MPKEKTKLWYLSRANIFRDLPKDILSEIAEASRMESFERGVYISTPLDDFGEKIYFLKEGEVEVYESNDEGKKITIDILKPGDVFGYDNIANEEGDDGGKFIKANRNATICIMPKSDFLALLAKKPDLALRIIKDLSKKLSTAEDRFRDTALSNSETRVIQELERLYKKYGKEKNGKRVIDHKFTHEELANLVGTTRETVTRTLAKLLEKGKVSLDSTGRFVLQ